MKFTAEVGEILPIVKNLCRVIDPKAPLPAMQMILFNVDKDDDNILLVAGNEQMELEYSFCPDFEEQPDDVKFMIPAKLLRDVLSNINEETVTFDADIEALKNGGRMTLEFNCGSTYMPTMSGDTYPEFQVSPGKRREIVLPPMHIMAPIKSCLWAKADDGVRLVMDSICLNWLGPELETVVTDGVSLLIAEHESQEDAATLVIPSGVADIIPSVFNTEDPLRVTFTDHHASISQNYTACLKFRCLENKYPNYAAVIPAAFGDSVTILRENLVRALKLACPFSDDKSYRAVLQFGACTLSVTAQNEVEETGMSRILRPEASTIKEDGDGTSICVNANKLLSILTKTVVTQKVYLSFSNHDGTCVSPIRICGDGSEATAYLMPMHMPT